MGDLHSQWWPVKGKGCVAFAFHAFGAPGLLTVNLGAYYYGQVSGVRIRTSISPTLYNRYSYCNYAGTASLFPFPKAFTFMWGLWTPPNNCSGPQVHAQVLYPFGNTRQW